MKWIEIAKAKPKFGEQYLIVSPDHKPTIGELSQTVQTANGLKHSFSGTEDKFIDDATHIALISLPE